MKQAVIVVLVLAITLVAWLFLWFRNEDAVATSASRPWPGEMGSLDDVVNRWPSLKANDGSVKFKALAQALPESESIGDFVERVRREAPELEVSFVQSFLAAGQTEISERLSLAGRTLLQLRDVDRRGFAGWRGA